ncbi:hypothetical protein B1F75_20085 [Pseudomonas syringae]|nr:hypothetical protein B1F75_20085 [Pseudomonas syringae]
MQRYYSIHYKLHGAPKEEPVIWTNANEHPLTEFSALQIITAKHGLLPKGEPVRRDLYEESEELGITDVRILESTNSNIAE